MHSDRVLNAPVNFGGFVSFATSSNTQVVPVPKVFLAGLSTQCHCEIHHIRRTTIEISLTMLLAILALALLTRIPWVKRLVSYLVSQLCCVVKHRTWIRTPKVFAWLGDGVLKQREMADVSSRFLYGLYRWQSIENGSIHYAPAFLVQLTVSIWGEDSSLFQSVLKFVPKQCPSSPGSFTVELLLILSLSQGQSAAFPAPIIA